MATQENDISWALKLLEREHDYEPNLLAKHWIVGCSTLTGLAIPLLLNYYSRRPFWSGIHQYALTGGLGFGIGHLLNKRELYVLARRDAILRDYIQRHPEDFPPPNTKKYGELFNPWTPIR